MQLKLTNSAIVLRALKVVWDKVQIREWGASKLHHSISSYVTHMFPHILIFEYV